MALIFAFDRNNVYPYPWYISDMAITADVKDIIGMNVEKSFATFRNGAIAVYYDAESTNSIGTRLLDRIIAGRSFFKKVITTIYEKSDNLLIFCNDIRNQNLQTRSDRELLDICSVYIEKLRELRTWGWVPVFLDGITDPFLTTLLMTRLEEFLKAKGREAKISEYYTLLSSSEKQSEVQQEELARIDLLLELQMQSDFEILFAYIKTGNISMIQNTYPEAFRRLEKHAQEFGWLTYAYEGPTMSIEYLCKTLAENLETGDFTKQKGTIVEHFKNITTQKAALITELQLPEELCYLCTVSSELMFMKDFRKGSYQKSYVAMDPVMKEIADRLGVSLKEVKYLVIDEIRTALTGRERDIYAAKAKERLVSCCYIAQGGKISMHEGAKCDELKLQLVAETSLTTEEMSTVKETKGTIAYSGIVRGIVRIVLTVEDIPKVNEGDILISSATNPDLILAMKKAAAFVTDTGGIISHAAIVSREMKKPCVVGTKIATHVFKDGDFIEVDATKGVVRRIEDKS